MATTITAILIVFFIGQAFSHRSAKSANLLPTFVAPFTPPGYKLESRTSLEIEMRTNNFNAFFAFLILLAIPVLMSAQSAPRPQTLVVNGQAGKTTVMQVNGRAYVDVESIAQIGNGSVAIKDNQITLTLPPPPAGSPAGQSSNPGFSREFPSAAIESIAAVREWRTAIATAIEYPNPVTDSWVSVFRGRANDALRQASVAAITSMDRAALQLLTNEFNNMQKWSDQIIAARKNLQYMSSTEINSDSLYQQILICSH